MVNLKSLPLLLASCGFMLTMIFPSCKKNEVVKNTSPDTVSLILTGVDTGNNTIGAAKIEAMFTAVKPVISFKNSAAIKLVSQHNIAISGISASQITLISCENVTITHCQVGPGTSKPGIVLSYCANIKIDSCYIAEVPTGISVENSSGIEITHCEAKNMLGPFPEGQFVQFKNVSGAGNRISYCKFENILGKSYPEDAISTLKSNGTAASPIIIEGNWIRGGGPSHSGGGIMLGDGGGSYIVAKNNILVDAGQYGMAVAGGSHMSIVNNTVFGKSQYFTSVGLYYRNYSGPPSNNIFIGKNAVNFMNSKNEVSTTYLYEKERAPGGWTTNMYAAGLLATILPENIVSDFVATHP